MKVYFTSSSKGSHANLDEIRGIINILKSLNVDLVIAWDKLKAIEGDAYKEKKANPEKIFKGNIAAITQSDLAIFETSVPSWGLGYQVAVATTNGIPTLCLYTKEGENSAISNLIGGVRSPLLQYKAYSNQQELTELLKEFIETSQSRELVKFNFIITQELKELISLKAKQAGVSTSKHLRDFLYQHMHKL